MSLTRILGVYDDNVVNATKDMFVVHPSLYGNICFDMVRNDGILVDSLRKRKSDPSAYLECYIREIDNMLPSQYQEAMGILSENLDEDVILIEIGYSVIGYFFLYNIKTGIGYQPN